MASSIYLGVPGSGKSFGIVKHCIVPALKQGRRVVSNIPLNVDKLSEYLGTDVSTLVVFFDFADFSAANFWFTQKDRGDTFTKNGDLIVIDEAHKYLINFRDTHPLFVAIREQRHYADDKGNPIDIIFATQAFSDIPRKLSPVCDTMYVMQKMEAVGSPSRYSVNVFNKCNVSPERQAPLNTLYGSYEPEYFELYVSFSHAQQATSGFEGFNLEKLDDRVNIWNAPVNFLFFNIPFLTTKRAVVLAVLFVLVCIYFAFKSFTSMSDITTISAPSKSNTKPSASASASSAPSAAPALPANTTAPKPVASSIQAGESAQFRLVGFYQFNSIPVAVVSDSDGKYRYLVNSFERVYAGPASHIKYNGEIIAPWTGSPNKIKSANSSTSNIFGALSK